MPQIGFAPSMAALMGVPIPFGNIGQISQELWDVAHSAGGSASAKRPGMHYSRPCQDSYVQALGTNTAQVPSRQQDVISFHLTSPEEISYWVICVGSSKFASYAAGSHISECIRKRQAGFSAKGPASQAQPAVPDSCSPKQDNCKRL